MFGRKGRFSPSRILSVCTLTQPTCTHGWKHLQLINYPPSPACCRLMPCVYVCMHDNRFCTHTLTDGPIPQGFRRRAVWPYRGKRFLHGERREHTDPTSPWCCQLLTQDGHRTQRPEGNTQTYFFLSFPHMHTLTLFSHTSKPQNLFALAWQLLIYSSNNVRGSTHAMNCG